ncbi:hypothetical protein [Caulobacter mirabilis]|uniref:SAM-dependent methyltransferase n=1 Tax=Caulobacter mirabilis TaxID=69666 RepID=A0A2D2ASV7_9CAUL|nr:hypothetical protein [Caulobacter mirabilis]ATQ41098.1 hypothetical protein CSW64_01085 [Caulobacter mirabilis]
MVSALFRHVEALQAGAPWDDFLDAGTGVNSSLWSTGLGVSRWVGVTGSSGHAAQVRDAVGDRLRPQDQLIVGNWTDPGLLRGERFDTVLADYLLGAVEGFSPYFQGDLFARLRPLVGRRLYVVGLDPYVVGEIPDEAAAMTRAIGRLRDSCLLLADETPYREYPAEWTVAALERSGFRVLSARRFANRYRERWVNSQLDMALRRLPKIGDAELAAALEVRIGALRAEGLALCRRDGGLRAGHDWVIACEPV